MGRFTKCLRTVLPASGCLAAGCASPYGESRTNTLIMGSLFIILGVVIAIVFISSRR